MSEVDGEIKIKSPPPPIMVMQPLPVSSARVEAMPKVPLAKASNSNTPERWR